MRDLSELPDDLLVKILSLLPTKDAVATSVLSKQWSYLWKQNDIDRVEFCAKYRCGEWLWDEFASGFRGPDSRFIKKIKAKACIECRERIQAEKKVIIFVLYDAKYPKTRAVIRTKLEDKKRIQIEKVRRGKIIRTSLITVRRLTLEEHYFSVARQIKKQRCSISTYYSSFIS